MCEKHGAAFWAGGAEGYPFTLNQIQLPSLKGQGILTLNTNVITKRLSQSDYEATDQT